MLTIARQDATYGAVIPAGRNPTLLAWYVLQDGKRVDGPLDTKIDAQEALCALCEERLAVIRKAELAAFRAF